MTQSSAVKSHRVDSAPLPLSTVSMGVAERVDLAREKMGLSQRELERRAGLSVGYISRLRNVLDGDMRRNTAVSLAAVLGVSVEWLLDGGEEPQRSAGHAPTVTTKLERYPERAAALVVFRSQQAERLEDAELVEEAAAEVASTAHDSDDDPGAAH